MTVMTGFSRGMARVFVLALTVSMVAVATGSGPAAALSSPFYVSQWGTIGSGDGQFHGPFAVAVDPGGNVYVVDRENDRVQRFTGDGTYLTQWGTGGSANGQFDFAGGVAVDSAGDVYVADQSNQRVQKFTADGTFLMKWGSFGTGNGQFSYPDGIAVDGDGLVYVADSYNHRIQRFTDTGTYVDQWGGQGSGNGQFEYPRAVAVDAEGNVYVTDSGSNRVQKFAADGTYLDQWSTGTESNPYGVTVDPLGSVLVVGRDSQMVQLFTPDGTLLTEWGGQGTGDGQFRSPQGVATDADGAIFVTDFDNDRVQKFGPARQPDGRIKLGRSGTLKGDDVYNTTGQGQTRRASVAAGATATYFVSIENESPFPDAMRLRGTRGTTRYRIKYTKNGDGITGAVTSGTYTTPVLDPGATFTVKVQVTALAGAPRGSSITGTLLTKSDSDTSARDTVRFITTRA